MNYLSIGKVSKEKNVSIKSLRYYDKIGILKPAYINESTNYRYYTEEQLYLLDAIKLCIELGIPLKDMQQYVENDCLQIQRLLQDSKMIAEAKIKEINSHITQLENTLSTLHWTEKIEENQSIDTSVTTSLIENVENNEHIKLDTPPEISIDISTDALNDLQPSVEEIRPIYSNLNKSWTSTTLFLLALPLECPIVSYGSYILQLFVTAQKNKLQANYPSGILYERKNGVFSKYMFLALTAHVPLSNDHITLLSDYSIRTLSTKECTIHYQKERISTDALATDIFSISDTQDYLILEMDTTDTQRKNDGFSFELIHYN